jgi:elongation factor G
MRRTIRTGLLSLAITPNTSADRQRLLDGLRTLTAEDPTIGVESADTGGTYVIGAMGELHLEIIVHRLAREFHVEAVVGRPQVAYRQTATRTAQGECKYLGADGGEPQYAHAKLQVHPADLGTGYVFQSSVVGPAIPPRFITAIDEGIADALGCGPPGGYPVDDVRVELCDGSYHDLESSESAFRIAGRLAFEDALAKADPALLEPVMRVEVLVPVRNAGAVTADLLARRARIQSQHVRGEMQFLDARVPLAQMFGYNTGLRADTFGRGSFTMEFDHYQLFRPDDDDRISPVRVPRKPAPFLRESSVALPEPDQDPPVGC